MRNPTVIITFITIDVLGMLSLQWPAKASQAVEVATNVSVPRATRALPATNQKFHLVADIRRNRPSGTGPTEQRQRSYSLEHGRYLSLLILGVGY